MAKQFHKSVAKLKREKFREYAKQNVTWPDDEMSDQFDQAISGIEKKRIENYIDSLGKKYPESLLNKVFEWARQNLSEMEMKKIDSEEIIFRFIEENPSKITSTEIASAFDEKGQPKKMIPHPHNAPIEGIEEDIGEGGYKEKIKSKIHITPKPLPSVAQLKKMSSSEIEKIALEHGINLTQVE